MRSGTSFRTRVLVVLVLLLTATLQPTVAFGAGRSPRQVTIHRIGNPSWKPVDFNVFSAPVGTAESGYVEFLETTLGLLPLHAFHPQFGVGPGQPHDPPYGRELSQGVDAAGYDVGRSFDTTQFSEGQAVFAAWMVVPGGPRHIGSSPDFDSGRIIPNSLFPIHIDGTAYRNGAVFDAALANFDVPPLDDRLTPSFDVDGHSHFPMFIGDNADFAPPGIDLPGRYKYELTMLDQLGNGWSITVRFGIRRAC